ncbi:MAG: hypothetical protein RL005_336 [Planctomycetota bacterium]
MMPPPARAPSARLAWLAAGLATLASTAWCASRTGDLGPAQVTELVRVVFVSAWLPVLWMLAAAGWGRMACRVLRLRRDDPAEHAALVIGLGICLQLVIDAWCAWLGVLAWQRPIGASIPLVAGLAGLVGAPRSLHLTPPRVGWLVALAVPVGVLAAAASTAPGWLWQTEFGGYDALTYHLLLPREWLEAGRMATLDHNVYSGLPSFVEAAFMQLLAFAPDPMLAGTWAQWLHAMIALAAALACAGSARCVARALGAPPEAITASGWLAAIALLTTPWIIVTGSLAYTELPVVLAMALAVMLLVPDQRDAPANGGAAAMHAGHDHAQSGASIVALALVAAAAVGAKGTAAGAIVVPSAALVVIGHRRRLRTMLLPCLVGVALGTVALMPWWLRNWIDAGQPLFPFVGALGPGRWWTAGQQEAFAAAHAAPPGLGLTALWNEWLRYGIGPAPDPSEPWRPQWLLLPWLGLAGVAFALRPRAGRIPRAALVLTVLVAANLVFWILFTHQKSRFLVPVAAPLAIAAGAMLAAIWAHRTTASDPGAGRWRRSAVGVLMLGMAAAVPWWYAGDGRAGAPAAAIGAEGVFTGASLGDELRAAGADDAAWLETARAASPAFVLNEMLAPCDRVYSLGESRGWYCRRIPDYRTVWDRGPLERMLAAGAQPDECLRDLRTSGWSHVLVDASMLRRWRASGWLDPGISDERVRAFTDRLTPVAVTAGECTVYRIPRGDDPTSDTP